MCLPSTCRCHRRGDDVKLLQFSTHACTTACNHSVLCRLFARICFFLHIRCWFETWSPCSRAHSSVHSSPFVCVYRTDLHRFFLLKAKCSLKYRIIGWLLAWAYRVRLRGMLRMSCKVHRLVVGQRSRFRFHSETEITANFPKWNPTAFHVSSNSIRSTFRVRFSRWLVPLLIQVDCIYRDFQSSVAQVHGRRHANTRPTRREG